MTGTEGSTAGSGRKPPLVQAGAYRAEPEPTGASKSQAQLPLDGRRWRALSRLEMLATRLLGGNRGFDFADHSQLTCGDGAQPKTAILLPAWTTHGARVPSSERNRRE